MSRVLRYAPERTEELRAFLRRGGFKFDSRPHAAFFAARPGVSVTAYLSGKLLVTGQQMDEFAGVLVGEELAFDDAPAPSPRVSSAAFEPHVGSDESGKGDYFGPLCVAAIYVPDDATAAMLAQKGVRDSKTLAPTEVGPLASLVKMRCPHAIVSIAPPRYNELYERVGNLNDLLAWAHARALEDVLAALPRETPVIVDQFARPQVLERHLRERGREARVQQVVRGESDVAVAAASIVARAEFVAGIAALERLHGVKLPKGAGPPVLRAARDIAARGGPGRLREVAKLHFATTRQVLGA